MDKAKTPEPMPATRDFGRRVKSLGPSHDDSWKMRHFLLTLSQEVMRRIHFRDLGEVGVHFHLQIVMVVFANTGVSRFVTRRIAPTLCLQPGHGTGLVAERLGAVRQSNNQWPRRAMTRGLFSDV